MATTVLKSLSPSVERHNFNNKFMGLAGALFFAAHANHSSASTVTWDFAALPDCAAAICTTGSSSYTSGGYKLNRNLDTDMNPAGFSYHSSSNPAYDGGGLLGSTNSYFTLSRTDGGLFSVESLVLRGSLNNALQNDIGFMFTAEYANGSILESTFNKNTGISSYEETVMPSWNDLVSLTISDDGFYQGGQSVSYEFDSLQMTSVPVPAALSLYASGLLLSGLGVFAKARRNK